MPKKPTKYYVDENVSVSVDILTSLFLRNNAFYNGSGTPNSSEVEAIKKALKESLQGYIYNVTKALPFVQENGILNISKEMIILLNGTIPSSIVKNMLDILTLTSSNNLNLNMTTMSAVAADLFIESINMTFNLTPKNVLEKPEGK